MGQSDPILRVSALYHGQRPPNRGEGRPRAGRGRAEGGGRRPADNNLPLPTDRQRRRPLICSTPSRQGPAPTPAVTTQTRARPRGHWSTRRGDRSGRYAGLASAPAWPTPRPVDLAPVARGRWSCGGVRGGVGDRHRERRHRDRGSDRPRPCQATTTFGERDTSAGTCRNRRPTAHDMWVILMAF